MARYAAERRSGEDLKAMEKALSDMKNAAAKGELGDEADLAFHYAIARASHNPVLEWMMESIYGILSRSLKESRQQLFLIPGYPDQLLQEHQKIYEAIAAQHAGKRKNPCSRIWRMWSKNCLPTAKNKKTCDEPGR